MFILRWAWNGFFHWPNESLVRALVTSVIFAAVFVFLRFSYWLPQRLIIGHDFVEARTRTGSLTFKKRIGREQIKSISENARGLRIMDRGQFAARMLGFVFVPASLPEYQEIKINSERMGAGTTPAVNLSAQQSHQTRGSYLAKTG